MGRLLNVVKKVAGAVKRADAVLMKKKVYQIVFALAFAVVFIALFDCFSSNKVFLNYDSSEYRYMNLFSGAKLTQSFESHGDSLRYLRIVVIPDKSILRSSDKGRVTLKDKDGTELMKKDFFLYNSSRNYIQIDCDDVKIEKGEKYSLEFYMFGMSKKSLLAVRTHKAISQAGFVGDEDTDCGIALGESDEIQDEITQDEVSGFSTALNIAYYYKSTNLIYAAVHLLLFGALVAVFFFPKTAKNTKFLEVIRAIGLPILLILLAEILNIESNGLIRIFGPQTLKHWYTLVAAIIVIGAIYFLLYMLTGLGSLSAIVTTILCASVAYTNHVKLVMRGDTFMPWDLFSAGIAVKTGSTYYFHWTVNFAVSLVFMLGVICFIRLTATRRYKLTKVRMSMMAFSAAFFFLTLFGIVFNTKMLDKLKIYYEVYPPFQSYNENGTYMAFLFHLNNLSARGNENNSKEATEELVYEYAAKAHSLKLDKQVKKDVKPNVICIMSEAYCDLDHIRELRTSEPQTPYYDALTRNTRDGSLAVSIFGGGTCNTEFEFLTGYSMNSLLPGSSVYTFYVNHETEALPYLFRQEGYRTVALHSFDGDWWERRAKYPLLGFNEFYTRDDFDLETTEYVRRYISDKETFKRICDIYDETEDPLFLFCVTMQNHADFSARYDNMAYDIKIDNVTKADGEHFNYAENYVSLLRESDDALMELIEHLKESDEPTIVCFFGDHLPTLDAGFYDAMIGKDLGTVSIEDSTELYETSYFVWANYDLGEEQKEDGVTSPNFLGQDILDLAGIELPDSRACLKVLENNIKAISSIAVYDNEGVPHTDLSTLPKDVRDMISDYSFIQYGLIYYDGEQEE